MSLIGELDGGGLVAAFTHGPGIDDPISVRFGPVELFYHTNHLGSIEKMTDMLGPTGKAYQYDAYGTILAEQGPSLVDEFAYTARKLHDRSGLYYYRARFYSPELGRFITQNPIGILGGTNLYAYVGNDPVNWVDPYGLKTYIYITGSIQGSYGIFSGEGGTYYLVDPLTGEYHRFGYLSGGVGLGLGFTGQLEGGVLEEAPCDPKEISIFSLTVSAFAAAGPKGISGQITGTSIWGQGEMGATVGPAGGAGFGISGMGTVSLFIEKGNVLPEQYRQVYQEVLRRYNR